jgi:hypothetical protein
MNCDHIPPGPRMRWLKDVGMKVGRRWQKAADWEERVSIISWAKVFQRALQLMRKSVSN